MSACNFDQLYQFTNKQLDLDKQLEVYDHLAGCEICRDAVHQLSRDRDGVVYRGHGLKYYASRRHRLTAWSGRAQVRTNAPANRSVARRSS